MHQSNNQSRNQAFINHLCTYQLIKQSQAITKNNELLKQNKVQAQDDTPPLLNVDVDAHGAHVCVFVCLVGVFACLFCHRHCGEQAVAQT